MSKRFALGLLAAVLISISAFPTDSLSQTKSLKDQLIGTWIYEFEQRHA